MAKKNLIQLVIGDLMEHQHLDFPEFEKEIERTIARRAPAALKSARIMTFYWQDKIVLQIRDDEGETDAAEVLAVDSESAALQYVEAYDAGQGGR